MSFAELLDILIRKTLAPGAVAELARSVRRVFADCPRDSLVLDVGCGYLSPLSYAGLATVGVDLDPERAQAHSGPAVAADALALPFADRRFAAVASMGLLHHLDDTEARRAIGELARVARDDGLIAIFDGVLPVSVWRRPLAALIRRLDFGGHMRDEAALRGLFEGAAGAWRFERITYAATGLEGVWCVRASKGPCGEGRHDR